MNSKTRYYNFILILYKEDKNFKEQFKTLKELGQLIWIEHTKDYNEDGTKKKAHYHFILKVKNNLTISSLAKKVSCGANMIEPIKKSFDGALKYLIHYNNEDKYQYSSSDVQSNSDKLLQRFKNAINEEEPGEEKAEAIEQIIDSYTEYIKLNVISKQIRKQGKWTYFLRYFNYFMRYIEEHNATIVAIENGYIQRDYAVVSSTQNIV